MPQTDYNLRAVITVAGAQRVSLYAHRRERGEGPSQLVIGFGPVLIYLLSAKAALMHYNAMRAAMLASRGLFPQGYVSHMGKAPNGAGGGFPVIASVTSQETDVFTVNQFRPAASPSGEPELAVGLGPLRVVFRDYAAVESVHRLCNDAVNMAALLWPGAVARSRATVADGDT